MMTALTYPQPLADKLARRGFVVEWEYPGVLVLTVDNRTQVWLDDDHLVGSLYILKDSTVAGEPAMWDECFCGKPEHDHRPSIEPEDPDDLDEIARLWAELLLKKEES